MFYLPQLEGSTFLSVFRLAGSLPNQISSWIPRVGAAAAPRWVLQRFLLRLVILAILSSCPRCLRLSPGSALSLRRGDIPSSLNAALSPCHPDVPSRAVGSPAAPVATRQRHPAGARTLFGGVVVVWVFSVFGLGVFWCVGCSLLCWVWLGWVCVSICSFSFDLLLEDGGLCVCLWVCLRLVWGFVSFGFV